MIGICPILLIIPICVLLTASYFVLFSVRKIEEKALKVFGYFVAAVLWLAMLSILIAGIYRLSEGTVCMKYHKFCPAMMRNSMPEKMCQGMMKGAVSSSEKPLVGQEKKEAMPKCAGKKLNL